MCDMGDQSWMAYPLVGPLASGGGGTNWGPYGKQGAKYQEMLAAYGSGMPEQLSLEQQYQPGFTEESLANLSEELTGANGQPGYLDIFSKDVMPAVTGANIAANTAARAANTADLGNLGPGTLAAMKAANPGQAALMDSLTKTATGQLALGTQLDPATTANINSSVQGNWASRGLGVSAPAQLDEAMNLYGGGQNVLAQREQEAGTVSNLNASQYTDPLFNLMGITSSAPQQALSLTATGANQAGGQAVIPSGTGYDMFNTIYNAQQAQNIDSANNTAALEGAGISAAGSVVGGGAMMGGF